MNVLFAEIEEGCTMYKFKINSINANSLNENVIVPKKINVIVGPNNSGKSRLLKEIRDYLTGDITDLKIINTIDFSMPTSFDELDESYDINNKIIRDEYGNTTFKFYINKPDRIYDNSFSIDNYLTRNQPSFGGFDIANNTNEIISRENKIEFLRYFGGFFFQYLGTEERLMICKAQTNYGLNGNSINYLSSFRFDDVLLNELAEYTKKLFNKDIVLDVHTLGSKLCFRVGEDLNYVKEKININQEIANRLNSEKLLDDQGDGLKSFVSTFMTLKQKKFDVLLLDEPEAFLHPPLAHQLGEMIGELDSDNRTLFVATHSAEILKGILSKNNDVNVIRITRQGNQNNSIKILNKETLNTILLDPLLRVSRILEGVFCDHMVITESETDELIYQSLIEKVYPEVGISFVHGQNKQTLATIARLYKDIGINFDIVCDFDILRVSSELSSYLKITDLDEKEKSKIVNYADKLRINVNNFVGVSGITDDEKESIQKSMRNEVYHKKGVRYFDQEMQNRINDTLNLLSNHHIHILRTGELETILEKFDLDYKDKKIWISEAIRKIYDLSKEELENDDNIMVLINAIVKNSSNISGESYLRRG